MTGVSSLPKKCGGWEEKESREHREECRLVGETGEAKQEKVTSRPKGRGTRGFHPLELEGSGQPRRKKRNIG